jgi:hypothetical protein
MSAAGVAFVEGLLEMMEEKRQVITPCDEIYCNILTQY